MVNMARDDVTVAQLRAMDYQYATRFGESVAMCVMQIVAQTEDPYIKARAYEWRMWAMPQARAAAFDQDPVAGLLELWVLAGQQRQYFTEGEGTRYFGELPGCVSETTKQLEEQAEQLAYTVMNDKERRELPDDVRAWIADHPIEGQLMVRPTARADLAGLVSEAKHGGLQAVGSMEETFRDLNDRLAILTVQLPVEARWQADYLVQALFEERIQEPADAVVATAEKFTGFLDDFESTMDGQVSTLLDAIARERREIFEAVAVERAAILEAIGQERISAMSMLDEELIAATAKLDTVGRGLIDHFFVRLLEVLAVVGVFTFLIVALVLSVVRQRERNDD